MKEYQDYGSGLKKCWSEEYQGNKYNGAWKNQNNTLILEKANGERLLAFNGKRVLFESVRGWFFRVEKVNPKLSFHPEHLILLILRLLLIFRLLLILDVQ